MEAKSPDAPLAAVRWERLTRALFFAEDAGFDRRVGFRFRD